MFLSSHSVPLINMYTNFLLELKKKNVDDSTSYYIAHSCFCGKYNPLQSYA